MSNWDELKAIKQTKDNMKEILELKAKAYDIIGALEQLQRELQAVNAEIAKKTHEQTELQKKYEPGNGGGDH